MRADLPAGDRADHEQGRSEYSFTTTLHFVTDGRGHSTRGWVVGEAGHAEAGPHVSRRRDYAHVRQRGTCPPLLAGWGEARR